MPEFQDVHPISCILLDRHGRSELHRSEKPDQHLRLELKNVSGRTFQFMALDDDPDAQQYHIALQFRPQVLHPDCLTGVNQIRLSDTSQGAWKLHPPMHDQNGQENLYLQFTTDKIWEPGEKLVVDFEHFAANPERDTQGTRVNCKVNHVTLHSKPDTKLRFERPILMDVLDGDRELIIPGYGDHADFMLSLWQDDDLLSSVSKEQQGIKAGSTLLLRLTLVHLEGWQPGKKLTFSHSPSYEQGASKLKVSFHGSRGGGEERYAAMNASWDIQQPEGWSGYMSSILGSSLREQIMTPLEDISLVPDGTDNIVGNESIAIPITLKSDRVQGYFRVSYENLPGYRDGQQILPVALMAGGSRSKSKSTDLYDTAQKVIPLVNLTRLNAQEPEEIQPKTDRNTGMSMSFSSSTDETKTIVTGQRQGDGFRVKVYDNWALVVPRRGTTARLQVLKQTEGEWQVHQELDAGGNRNGGDAALSDKWLVMSAYTRQGLGKVLFYQLEEDQWVEKQTVNSSSENDWFGEQVDISGPWALFGASKDSSLVNGAGSASVFHLLDDQWRYQQRLGSENPQEGESFGRTVALDGETALIGSQKQTEDHPAKGRGHLFQLQGQEWQHQENLMPSGEGAPGDQFGFAMDMRHNQLLAGAIESGRTNKLYNFQPQDGAMQPSQVLNLSDDLTRPDLFNSLNAIGIDGTQTQINSQQGINLNSFLDGNNDNQ